MDFLASGPTAGCQRGNRRMGRRCHGCDPAQAGRAGGARKRGAFQHHGQRHSSTGLMARADGHVFWCNQRWYEYTGTTQEQMEGWGWQNVNDPQVLPKVLERWRRSIANGQPLDMEFPLRGADGRFRPFLNRCMPLKDHQGQVVLWFGTNTDITEHKRLQEHLEEAVQERTAKLHEALAELEHMSYSMVHICARPSAPCRALPVSCKRNAPVVCSPRPRTFGFASGKPPTA